MGCEQHHFLVVTKAEWMAIAFIKPTDFSITLVGQEDNHKQSKMMMGRALATAASRRWLLVAREGGTVIANTTTTAMQPQVRPYTTTIPLSDLSKYYRVEVSNAARSDATKITVKGPDVDGILASMTVALAQQGCSLKELHAGYSDVNETVSFEKHVEGDRIEDIFFVAKHETGKQFPDEALYDLGKSLLKSLSNPMPCLSGKQEEGSLPLEEGMERTGEEQITVVKQKKLT